MTPTQRFWLAVLLSVLSGYAFVEGLPSLEHWGPWDDDGDELLIIGALVGQLASLYHLIAAAVARAIQSTSSPAPGQTR